MQLELIIIYSLKYKMRIQRRGRGIIPIPSSITLILTLMALFMSTVLTIKLSQLSATKSDDKIITEDPNEEEERFEESVFNSFLS